MKPTERSMRAKVRLATDAVEDARARLARTGSAEDEARVKRAKQAEDIEWDRLQDARDRGGRDS